MFAFLLLGAACGGDKGGGTAGGPAAPLGLGERCSGDECASGLVCDHGGAFSGQCTAQCANDNGCTLLAPGAKCLGGPPAECAIACAGAGGCPAGTGCVAVSGGMACKVQ